MIVDLNTKQNQYKSTKEMSKGKVNQKEYREETSTKLTLTASTLLARVKASTKEGYLRVGLNNKGVLTVTGTLTDTPNAVISNFKNDKYNRNALVYIGINKSKRIGGLHHIAGTIRDLESLDGISNGDIVDYLSSFKSGKVKWSEEGTWWGHGAGLGTERVPAVPEGGFKTVKAEGVTYEGIDPVGTLKSQISLRENIKYIVLTKYPQVDGSTNATIVSKGSVEESRRKSEEKKRRKGEIERAEEDVRPKKSKKITKKSKNNGGFMEVDDEIVPEVAPEESSDSEVNTPTGKGGLAESSSDDNPSESNEEKSEGSEASDSEDIGSMTPEQIMGSSIGQ